MGNISSMARASTALDSYVAELGNDISYDKSLSSSRFLKSILARHAYGPLVLKIFIKPDAAMSLRVIQRRLKAERDALSDLNSTNTYQAFVETEKAGYLIRQWVGSNLYDRVSTQPYLATVEKKWVAFQLLTALRDARARKVAHGDIKSENILITADLSLVLTDFSSSFKPTFLPLDDPSDFSFYFDTSSRRTCYIAPERFYTSDSKLAEEKRTAAVNRDISSGHTGTGGGAGTAGSDSWGKRDGKVTEDMDVFSAGCVIAELWTDGRTVFSLSELYSYKEGSIGLGGILDNIEDQHVKDMITQMLSLDPKDRPNFDHILSTYRGLIFPEYFYTFLRDYTSSLNDIGDQADSPFLQKVSPMPGTRIDRMLEEWDSISVHLESMSSQHDQDGPALLLLNLVTASIRNCRWPSSRLHGLELFLRLSPHISDEDKIDRIIPFIVELLSDEVAIVRAEACRALVLVVESITSITPQNAAYIPEYLFPQMRHLSTDSDVFVRATYARGLVKLADAAVSMLELSQAAKLDRNAPIQAGVVEPDYDAMLLEIQALVEEQTATLLVDYTPAVKRSMLSNIADLCLFFGRQKSSETVLSHIMTYLNDRDWMLRLAFFDGIVGVGAFIGIRAVEEYVLPLMLQALSDPEEAVVARVVVALTSLASLGLLPRMQIWDVFFAIRGLLCHPNIWIRQGTAGFVAAAARNLPESDIWCILYPNLRPMLQCDILELDEISLLSSLEEALPRATLVAARSAAIQSSPPGFWDLKPTPNNTKGTLVSFAQSDDHPATNLLKDKGISIKEEKQIIALKEIILKQAWALRARETTDMSPAVDSDLTNGKSVSLIDLGVTPQTVFVSSRTVGVSAKTDLKRLKPHLTEASSRRTSFASKSGKSIDSPLDEIRKRLAHMEPIPIPKQVEPPSPAPVSAGSPSESTMSSSVDLTAMASGSKKRVDSKAAPAVGASHTNAVGTTTVHDVLPSGQTTPTAASMLTSRGPLAPYSSSYEGQDPGVRAFLEQVDLENYREPLLDFGPRVTASHRKRSPRPKTTSSTPGVTMIAHLTQHTAPITSIVVPPDHLFFATASDDSQILIWDTARLERSVATKARLTYRMDEPISAMGRIDNTHCLVAASEDRQVHVLRVHVTSTNNSTKYSRVECVRTFVTKEEDGHVIFLHHARGSSLLLVTSRSVIGLLDMRTMELVKRYQHPLEHGVINAICPSTNWLMIGTELGILSLWDLRFGLLLKSWKAPGPVNSIHIHPSRGKGRWVICAIERSDANSPIAMVYDIETSRLVETYEIRATRSATATVNKVEPDEITSSQSELVAELAEKEWQLPKDDEQIPSVLSLIVGQGLAMGSAKDDDRGKNSKGDSGDGRSVPGWMVTAGEDRVVRYWDMMKVSESMVVCGSPKETDVVFKHGSTSNPDTYYTYPNPHRQSIDLRNPNTNLSRQPLRPHYDAICALGHVETPFSSCVISGDRSGVLKVWRLEGVGGK